MIFVTSVICDLSSMFTEYSFAPHSIHFRLFLATPKFRVAFAPFHFSVAKNFLKWAVYMTCLTSFSTNEFDLLSKQDVLSNRWIFSGKCKSFQHQKVIFLEVIALKALKRSEKITSNHTHLHFRRACGRSFPLRIFWHNMTQLTSKNQCDEHLNILACQIQPQYNCTISISMNVDAFSSPGTFCNTTNQ